MDFLRSKQSGVSRDFTKVLAETPELFMLDEVAKYGLDSEISTLAYDPVQSLLAIGTQATASTGGKVYIFGQKRVEVVFELPRKGSAKFLQLVDSKVLAVDSKNELTVFDMGRPGAPGLGFSPPSAVTALLTDPCLDWAFLGLQTGEVLVYDIDREMIAPLRLPNFWRERSPKARLLPVVSLALHPKDVGTLLIGYLEGAVVYSFKQNVVLHHLHFELPAGAPGADAEMSMINTVRRPKLSQALWHPTGTFILTSHEDSCMAIWDPKDGKLMQARTLEEGSIHLPRGTSGPHAYGASTESGTVSIKQPLFKVAWCSTSNPDDTSLLIAGGNEMTMPAKGITMLDLGPTPNMLTSSVQIVTDHFEHPRRQRILPTPAGLDVINFCLIPKASPHFGGTHDPVAVVALLASGELVTLRWPDGQPLSSARLLHPSLNLQHPFATRADLSQVMRERWIGSKERRNKGMEIIVGGAEQPKPYKRFENRSVVQTSHSNGVVRIFDLGHADELENGDIIEIDQSMALQRGTDLKIDVVSMAGATAETAVAMASGEVVIWRWQKNKVYGMTPEPAMNPSETKTGFRDVQRFADPDVKQGLLPLCILEENCGKVDCMKMSDVGFCAVAYETGFLTVIDLRGPAVIYHESLTALTKEQKRSSFRKSKEIPQAGEKASILEFGVLTLEGDEFSSIALFVGTTHGRLLTFKLLPAEGGRFACTPAGSSNCEGGIVSITPLNADSGARAWATQQAVANLRQGIKVPGVLCITTSHEAKIFKPPASKGAHRSFDDGQTCVSAEVTELEDHGTVLTCILTSTTAVPVARSYSLPGLKEIATVTLPQLLPDRLHEAKITERGYILSWSAAHELLLLYLWGKGSTLAAMPKDTLYNPELVQPPRPTISNLQWLSGTQHVSTADLDLLIAGPDRPMSKKMLEQERLQAKEQREAERMRGAAGPAGAEATGDGVWANMAKGITERTEKLNIMGDSMDRLGETSANFADDVSKYVKQQQRNALLGGLKSKFF